MEVDACSKVFEVVGVRVSPSVVQILASHLELEIDDAEFVISRTKAQSAEQTELMTGNFLALPNLS